MYKKIIIKYNKITLNIIIEWFLIYNIIIRISWHTCYNVWNKIIARRKEQRHIKKIVDKQMEDLDTEIRILNSKYNIFDNMEGIW